MASVLPALEDVLQQFGHRAYLDIELKVSGNEETVVAALQAHPPQRGFIVSSFLPEILAGCTTSTPACPWDSSATATKPWTSGVNCPSRSSFCRTTLCAASS